MPSDAVIAAIASVLAAALGVLNAWISRKQAGVIKELEKNTNSIKDALVKVTAENAERKGHAIGVADEKARATEEQPDRVSEKDKRTAIKEAVDVAEHGTDTKEGYRR